MTIPTAMSLDDLDKVIYKALMTGPNRWAEATINDKLVSFYEVHNVEVLKQALLKWADEQRVDEIYRWFDKEWVDAGSPNTSISHPMDKVKKRVETLTGGEE